MKALLADNFGTIDTLLFTEIPNPKPAKDEVLIKTAYVGVNPVDWKICEGYLRKTLPHQFPIVLGWDVSGTIVGKGEEVTEFKEGDEIYAYCRKPVVHMGTYAEYVTFPAKDIAPKPKSLSLAQAAGIPLVALTAWQSIFDCAQLKQGETILIHAGAGGVGSIAIGLAHNAGAKVYTTASSANHDYVKTLGADVAIDYREKDFVEQMKELEPNGVDVLYDCVGYETLDKSYELVKKGGRLVSIVKKPEKELAEKYGIQASFVLVRPDGEDLRQLGDLLDSGKIKPPEIHERNFDEAIEVFREMQKGHTRGKNVLKVAS